VWFSLEDDFRNNQELLQSWKRAPCSGYHHNIRENALVVARKSNETTTRHESPKKVGGFEDESAGLHVPLLQQGQTTIGLHATCPHTTGYQRTFPANSAMETLSNAFADALLCTVAATAPSPPRQLWKETSIKECR
jgi:hypothetical protein